MYATDETRRLRLRDAEDLQAQADLDDYHEPANITVAGITTVKTTYPTTAKVFYAVQIQSITGTETEGGAYTLSPGDTVLAANLGSAIPAQGTTVELRYVPYRWCFTYDG